MSCRRNEALVAVSRQAEDLRSLLRAYILGDGRPLTREDEYFVSAWHSHRNAGHPARVATTLAVKELGWEEE